MSGSHHRFGVRFALVFASLLFVVVLFEGALRLIFPLDLGSSRQHRIPHPALGWTLEPGASYTNAIGSLEIPVAYNARGWRDRERGPLPEPGMEYLVVLGDSFMEGYSVPMEDLFARRLENDLAAGGRPAEVVNLGVGGFGTLQELMAFEQEGSRYRPSIVLLGFSENDLANNLQALEQLANPAGDLKSASRPYLDPAGSEWQVSVVDYEGALARFRAGRERDANSLAKAIYRNSALVQQVGHGIRRIKRIVKQQRKRAAAASVAPSEHCNGLYREAWDVTARILERLRDEVGRAGARLVLFTVPFVGQVEVAAADQALSCKPCVCPTANPPLSRLPAIASELRIEFVDLYPLVSGESAGDPQRLYHVEDSHWNAAGHELAARALTEALLAQ